MRCHICDVTLLKLEKTWERTKKVTHEHQAIIYLEIAG